MRIPRPLSPATRPRPLVWLLLSAALAQGALDRPRLQILNAGPEVIEVFWITPDGQRVPNGKIEPGQHHVIGTTLGHRFVIVDGDSETEVVSQVPVQAFRHDPAARDGIPSFYSQVAYVEGYPICASARVNPYALREAAHLVGLMLAKRPDVREAMIASGSRLCILAHDEFTTDQPEWAWLADGAAEGFEAFSAKDYRDARARGMGGSPTDPFCSCAEENLLGYEGDPYAAECILIHEFAHNIHLRGMANVDPGFDARVKAAYDAAMRAGRWRGTYASVNHHEYFAEGVQSWFDNNRENDHDHNHVNTRAELLEHDPGLAALCREVFGDTALTYTKPATRRTGHLAGYDPATAPRFVWPERLQGVREAIRAAAVRRSQAAQAAEPETHQAHRIAGWTVRISTRLAEQAPDATRTVLRLLHVQLEEITRVVPAPALAHLREVPLWVNPEYPGVPPRAEYHPDADWLRRNQRDPAMARSVEFTNARIFEAEARRMPNFALHELAHAYHHRVLGHERPEILAAFARARESGLYDRVPRQDSEGRKRLDKAYAMTNAKEYFAEGTEAYFTGNDFFPFTRDELKTHDPDLFELLGKLWELP